MKRSLSLGWKNSCSILAACILAACVSPAIGSKEPLVSAVELYAGAEGPAYAQIAGLLINGRTEVRLCGPADSLDKNTYSRLERVSVVSGGSLARKADGSLEWTTNGTVACVVPDNIKFEKKDTFTPAELAEKLVIEGKVVASDPAGLQAPLPLKAGDRLVFVSDPDAETDEYLRAGWQPSIPGWQAYLDKYPGSRHTGEAKQNLAALEATAGTGKLQAFQKSLSSGAPDDASLKAARERSAQALALAPDLSAAKLLRDDVHSQLATLAAQGETELRAYQAALTARQSGYIHLVNAQKTADRITAVDDHFAPGKELQSAVAAESHALDGAVGAAQALLASGHDDEAFAAVEKYRALAGEDTKIAAVVNAASAYHFDRGTAAEKSGDWPSAVQEYQKAAAVNSTPEIASALKNAEAQSQTTKNKQLADAASQRSQELVQQRNYIEAYEVLAALPEGAKALVAEQLASVQSSYIQAASERAKQLQQVHYPIRGRADLDSMRQAYTYLRTASEFGDNQDLKERLAIVADEISGYYLQQAKLYFDKPLASGVNLGWYLLDEAQLYRPDLSLIRDERTKNASNYQLRSRLSIAVLFRDQTSRTDLKDVSFADQLRDAVGAGLESAGLPVTVVSSSGAGSIEPNFVLVGEILQHRPMHTETPETLESKYRVGERDVPNDAWNKADKDYEAATLELQQQQSLLAAAQVHNKKKEIERVNRTLAADKQAVEDARAKLNAIPRSLQEDTVKPYHYTKITLDVTPIVELAFRIKDRSDQTVFGPATIKQADTRHFVILEGLKPEDTEGLKQQDARPDQDQWMIDAENEARDTLVKEAQEAVQSLPKVILEQARNRMKSADTDGAAEFYILYLNSTPAGQTPERDEARRFLVDNFNIRNTLLPAPNSIPAPSEARVKEQPIKAQVQP